MNKSTIGVVTSTRADYGIFRPLLFKLREYQDQINLELYVTGMHLSDKFGMTVNQLYSDGFEPTFAVPIITNDENIAQETAEAIARFGDIFIKHKPDLLIVLGDRYEIFGIATAATIHHIPIAHIHGGELTDGALDNVFRHAITKMSYLHFASTESYRKRIIQLGEHPSRVFNVGAMGVENCLSLPLLSLDSLNELLNTSLRDFIVVVFHPETMSEVAPVEQYREVVAALQPFASTNQFVFIFSNSDPGGQLINEEIERFCTTSTNSIWFKSLSTLHYLSLVSHAKMIVGNSSSGIIEAPSLHTPTVNIGNRQKGREAAKSILHVPTNISSIHKAVQLLLNEPVPEEFFRSPYGSGGSSDAIANTLLNVSMKNIELAKPFYDCEGEAHDEF